MSVLKRFRSESKMQFYATAQKLRKDIMTLLLKDFGVRSKVRQLDIETRHMTQDDRNAFLAIAERYGITAAEAEFPAWLHLLQNPLFFHAVRQAPDAACERDFHARAAAPENAVSACAMR